MKRYSLFLVLAGLLFFKSADSQTKNQSKTKQTTTSKKTTSNPNRLINPEIWWHGTITVIEKYSGLIGRSERYISLFFGKALPTNYRNIETTDINFNDNKGTGKVSEYSEYIIRSKDEKTGVESEKIIDRCDCSGQGQSELHEVVIELRDGIYRIHAIPPPCKGKLGDGCGGTSWDVIISDKRLGSNPFSLSGSETVERDLTTGKVTTTTTWDLTGCTPWNHPKTQKYIETLEPKAKAAANRFIQRVNDELCIKLKITSGHRTDDEQDYEYSKGRTISSGIKVTSNKPLGETVTDAKAGESNHNFGRAIDVYYATETGIDLDAVLAPEIVEIAKQEGFHWGGNWKKPDYPHFEFKE